MSTFLRRTLLAIAVCALPLTAFAGEQFRVAACTLPTINTNPADTTVTSGKSTTLTVSASNATSYQWYVGTSGTTTTPYAGAAATTASITVSPTTTTKYWVRVTNSCGSVNSNTTTVTVNPAPVIVGRRNDFDGNGVSDLLWWNASSGQVNEWQLASGGVLQSNIILGTIWDTTDQVVATADMNGDGKADVIWQHRSSMTGTTFNVGPGDVHIWTMDGGSIISNVSVATVPDLNWSIQGVGDFNGDGKADILWRHAITGSVSLWLMNGHVISANIGVAPVPDLDWKIQGVADTNGDGKSDVIWHHGKTGAVDGWIMNGGNIIQNTVIGTVPDLTWAIHGFGDFNNDGKHDILWQHTPNAYDLTRGEVVIWFLNGNTLVSHTQVATVSNWIYNIVSK